MADPVSAPRVVQLDKTPDGFVRHPASSCCGATVVTWQVGINRRRAVHDDEVTTVVDPRCNLCNTSLEVDRSVPEPGPVDPVSAHPSEPLWRGPTTQGAGPWRTISYITEEDGDLPSLHCEPGTEVEVWPSGSHPTLPTREQVIDVLSRIPSGEGGYPYEALNPRYEMVGQIADAVMALFSGVPTEETTDG